MGAVIEIKDITEGNKAQKLEALEKAFSGNPIKGIIKADNTPAMQNITLYMKDMSDKRMEKALRTLSMTLGVPSKAAKGEVFMYKAQEDLTDKWCGYFSTFVKELYEFTTDYFSLPKKTAMSKAENLVYKGKILYYPESGEPIKKADWEKFVKNLEKFLNRNKNPAERLILQSQSLGKILNRMLKYNTLEAVKKLRLEDMMYNGKSFDWITDSVKNMKDAFGDSLTRAEQARIEMLTQSAAQKVTNVTEKVRGDIQQILIDGVRNRKSKGQVSQELFDKMVGDNRDYQRLADTEIQNAVNNSFIREEVQSAPEGEKVYFQRIEVIDGNTCPFCRQMNGKIALWSDKPLKDEKAHDGIADFVIWEGKEWNGKGHSFTTGVFHPYCRGSWVRYDKDLDNARIDALIADRSGKASKWNNAVKQATKEFEEKGVKNPDDSTKGFTDRINQIFKGDDVKKSLEESDGVFINWKRTLKTYCDRHNLNYEEVMKPFHSETTKKLCEDLGADYENTIAYITHKHLTTEQFHNDLKRQLNGIDKSLTINEKLFRLWTRRVNPEFLKEVKKIYDGNRFISRAVYNIKGYPQGQDLENCELVNLGEDYLTISCGGDWQEEKLVKIELSDNGLIAKEVEEAEKEDGHILNKKRAYILSGVNKSLTWSGHKLQGRKNFAGLKISIENRKGSIRRGVDADGHEWAIKMNYDYGYIRGTEGVDGDHLDCYLGDNENAKKVYIIHQKIPGTKTYDEDKCMLGFNTLEDARQAYLSQYDKRGFLESIDTVDITVFKEKIFQNKYKGKRLDI